MLAVPHSSVVNVWLLYARLESRSWALCLYSAVKVQDRTDILFWLCDEKTHEGNEWASDEFSVGFVEMLRTATHLF